MPRQKRAGRSQPPEASSQELRLLKRSTGVRVSAALVRLHAMRPLLEAIDRRADTVPGDLDTAAKEFDVVAKLLTAIKPPSSRTSTHALLLRTCTLGARAARLRQTAAASQDAASGWEAASAAAGALLVLAGRTVNWDRSDAWFGIRDPGPEK